MAACMITTRLLILSDTHANRNHLSPSLTQQFDVVIHCGDLTEGSQLEEYRTTLATLSRLDAPLKLVIPGNHDFTLDDKAFEKVREESLRLDDNLDNEALDKAYGRIGEARTMLKAAPGITLLPDEGTYHYKLANGAKMTVFASPFTPSTSNSNWGFQYHPNEGHDWSGITDQVDIVLTHGPPQGIFDRTGGRRAGCPHLLRAVAKARPRLHCFGHIHEQWGARRVAWRDGRDHEGQELNHFSCIDNSRSESVETLAQVTLRSLDDEDTRKSKLKRIEEYTSAQAVNAWCRSATSDTGRLQETLFINAALESTADDENHFPFIVNIDLEKSE